MKLWGSMKQQAGKLAFETEKAVRIKREEGVVSGLKSQIEAQCTEMGKVVLGLYREGSFEHPQLDSFVQQIAHLQEQIKATEAKIAVMQAEEYAGEGGSASQSDVPDMSSRG
jgi:hypothetical protein